MDGTRSKKVILIAGMPRSGSTWLFNASRFLLEYGDSQLYAAWISDYDPGNPSKVHLVKAHRPSDVKFAVDIVLTTWRPIEACLASLIRMGWLSDDPDTLRQGYVRQKRLHQYWLDRTNLEVDFNEIENDPAAAVQRLATALGLSLESSQLTAVSTALSALQPPENGAPDSRTLLHPNHRRGEASITISASEILRRIGTVDIV